MNPEDADRHLQWRALDLLAQIVLRSHIASAEDRAEWSEIVETQTANERKTGGEDS